MMELYCFNPSPSCRAVMLLMRELNMEPTVKEIDLSKGEHLTPEFKSLNPQHTIPVIVDDGFVLSESRAILIYLVEQFGQNSTLYPADPKIRGVINQRLFFDIGTLYTRFCDAYSELFAPDGSGEVDTGKLKKLEEVFEFLEAFMADSPWMAGDTLTIADYSIVATISTIEACGFDLSKYEKVLGWLERCKTEIQGYEEINQKGIDEVKKFIEERTNK